MLWQAETGMYFRMAGGAGPWPIKFRMWPIVEAFMRRTYVPDASRQFKAYLSEHGVRAVIIDDDYLPLWQPLASTLGTPATEIGGVSMYEMPPQPEMDPRLTLPTMRVRFDIERFETVLTRVASYLSKGGSLNELTAAKAPALGLIPPDCMLGPSEAPPDQRHPELNWLRAEHYRYGVLLFVTKDQRVVVGGAAWYPAGRELMQKYGAIANEAHFLPEDIAKKARKNPEIIGTVAMAFSREQLAKAADIARHSETKLISTPAAPGAASVAPRLAATHASAR